MFVRWISMSCLPWEHYLGSKRRDLIKDQDVIKDAIKDVIKDVIKDTSLAVRDTIKDMLKMQWHELSKWTIWKILQMRIMMNKNNHFTD